MAKTYLSVGDFIDLYYKIGQKGYSKFFSKFRLSGKQRTATKWNNVVGGSDFWVIPEVRARWNEKSTGDENLTYEDYVVRKYFESKKGLRLLSVGCGAGARDRKFAKYDCFDSVEGIDLAGNLIRQAKSEAKKLNIDKLKYHEGNFLNYTFEPQSFDVILFNSSLHHFNNIDLFLSKRVRALLKPDGYLIVFEYVGPKRLQWTKKQIFEVNRLLKTLPNAYKLRSNGKSIKNKAYRPGILRMKLVDPSEAVDSESIVPALHKHFKINEEHQLGWDITHVLFKDIAHNFVNNKAETKQLIAQIFDAEDKFLEQTGSSNAIFGVYQK